MESTDTWIIEYINRHGIKEYIETSNPTDVRWAKQTKRQVKVRRKNAS